jgi:hypothetical protein
MNTMTSRRVRCAAARYFGWERRHRSSLWLIYVWMGGGRVSSKLKKLL